MTPRLGGCPSVTFGESSTFSGSLDALWAEAPLHRLSLPFCRKRSSSRASCLSTLARYRSRARYSLLKQFAGGARGSMESWHNRRRASSVGDRIAWKLNGSEAEPLGVIVRPRYLYQASTDARSRRKDPHENHAAPQVAGNASAAGAHPAQTTPACPFLACEPCAYAARGAEREAHTRCTGLEYDLDGQMIHLGNINKNYRLLSCHILSELTHCIKYKCESISFVV